MCRSHAGIVALQQADSKKHLENWKSNQKQGALRSDTMNPNLLSQGVQIGTGAAFILFPLIFVFAFSAHPGMLKPRMLPPEGIIRRARRNKMLHFGHALVLLCTGLLVVAAIQFMHALSQGKGAWAGLIGGVLAVLGALLLAADKGAFCLTMSALDTVSDDEFSAMMPGLLAIFSKKGWMVLLWGMILLPLGFAIQAIGLLQGHVVPAWQSILFIIGMLFIAVPDGMEIINLSASVLMAAAMIPYGIQLISAVI